MKRSVTIFVFAVFQIGIFAINNKYSYFTGDSIYPKPSFDEGLVHIDNSFLRISFPGACLRSTVRPSIKGVFSHNLKIHYTPNNTNSPYYLIIAENSLYNSLSKEIKIYAEDSHAIFGYGIYVETVQYSTPEDVKSLITSYSNNLIGVLLIGDVGECMYEVSNDHGSDGYRQWPCDLFYTDLDGTWTDSDSNGIYDGHSGNVAPEIFLGRLSAKGLSAYGDEEDLIRRQLQKSHDYWWKTSFHTQERTLNYIDQDWNTLFPSSTIKDVFSTLYITDVRANITPIFSVSDYLSRISSNTYGFTHLASHSDPVQHYFSNGNIYNYGLISINSNNYAYSLFCCSACNWLGGNSYGYLGGAYLFNNGKTIAIIGTTKTGGMFTESTPYFYSHLATKNLGESFLQWWHCWGNTHTDTIKYWIYGMTILGDPTIDFRYHVSDLCVNNLSVTSFPSNNTSNLVIYKAGNKITVSGNFVIPQGVHVVFDAPQVEFEGTFYCPLGASYETRDEGCEL